MFFKGNKNIAQRKNGFSIIEAAVLLVVGSVMIASYSSLMAKKMQADSINTTKMRLEAIKDAVTIYFDANGKMPCPASRNAAVDVATFGREVTTGACSGGDTVVASGRGGANVIIGAVPVRSLDLPDDYIADAWGGRFVYAVTQSLATPYAYNAANGAIYVYDKDGNDLRIPTGTAHFVVVALGPNRRGAYSVAGAAGLACTGAASEVENCDNDASFVLDLTTSTATVKTGYDDMLVFAPDNQVTLNDPIPSGMVLPFRLGACPTGWSDLAAAAGRIVIGLGNYTEPASPGGRPVWTFNKNYTRGETGGFARYRMITNELPSHRHTQNVGIAAGTVGAGWGEIFGGTLALGVRTQPTGGGQLYDNRQPYLALRYCRKN